MNTQTVWWWVGGVIVLILLVWIYVASTGASLPGVPGGNPSSSGQQSAGSEPGLGSNGSELKTYTNLQYGYSVQYPSSVYNQVAQPADVSFGVPGPTSTPQGTLTINVAGDVTHLAYCLTVPQGAKNVATTTIKGTAFLRYTGATGPGETAATTHYRTLHKALGGNVNECYDIQQTDNGSNSVKATLAVILQSFAFNK